VQFVTTNIQFGLKKYICSVSLSLDKHLHVVVLRWVYSRFIANGKRNRKKPNFPTAMELHEMARAVRSSRGSVVFIAARVKRRDGGTGVAHSAVSRTLSGYERNRPVIAAVKRFLRRRFPLNGFGGY
jgi:hypothetical protein